MWEWNFKNAPNTSLQSDSFPATPEETEELWDNITFGLEDVLIMASEYKGGAGHIISYFQPGKEVMNRRKRQQCAILIAKKTLGERYKGQHLP